MCGIGSLVSAWNASQRATRSDFHNSDQRMGAAGLVSALQDSAAEMPQEADGTADGCASLLNPASMAALIVEQARSSARASLGAFLMSQAGGSACGGPGGAQDLFAALDSDADGMISRSEFDAAFNGSNEAKATTTDQTDAPATGDSGADGETSQTTAEGTSASDPSSLTTSETTNPDGSTSTTITYPDGATVTFTTPPGSNAESSANDAAAPSFGRLPIESVLATLIRLQAHMSDATTA